MANSLTEELLQSTDMEPVHGTVDVNIPADVLWECFPPRQLVAALERLYVVGAQHRSDVGPAVDLGL